MRYGLLSHVAQDLRHHLARLAWDTSHMDGLAAAELRLRRAHGVADHARSHDIKLILGPSTDDGFFTAV
jgi:hypothetical protein